MIYLLDLNYTLVENSEDKASPFSKQIEGERYRAALIEALKDKRVFLLTARPDFYLVETVRNIIKKTGWKPERCYFNEHNLPPPQAKEIMLETLFEEFLDETFFGIESNPKTRAMYAKHGVESAPWEVWLNGKT
jgi:hypothetical protein